MAIGVESKHGEKIHVPSPVAELLRTEGGGDALVAEDPDLGREVGVEAVDEARWVDVEPAGDDLADCGDALVGAGGARPVETLGVAAVRGGDGAGEEERLLEVAFDGFGAGVFLHSLVADAAVGQEDGDLPPLEALLRLLLRSFGEIRVFFI